jgi:hypothetical protein
LSSQRELFKAFGRRGTAIFLLLGCSGFVAVGLFFLIADIPVKGGPTWFPEALGLTAILFFGCGFVLAPRLLSRVRPVLTIGPDGIEDRSSLVSGGLIPWSDISAVSERGLGRMMGQTLAIHLRPESGYARKLPGLQRFLLKVDRLLVGVEILINLRNIDATSHEIWTALEKWSEQARRPE